MDTNETVQLYIKERTYEQMVFGNYQDLNSLNLASFLVIIEHYLFKAKEAYAGKWTKDLPEWLNNCKELTQDDGTAPVAAYEQLIKIFALAGSALEAFTSIDANKWRSNAAEDMKKWISTCEE
jgi:hypothetical protein